MMTQGDVFLGHSVMTALPQCPGEDIKTRRGENMVNFGDGKTIKTHWQFLTGVTESPTFQG